ncbi:trans-1,2-dihydrobenzene-1,2-diol dehydrogenase-like [Patiria miniata]|uniref:Trans-1,2-dihydrobenzene-1,2-diol dehydrogenase n=1 Tax=Patiria miniata TaxID=46514 RepID=A0A913ZTF0_PATMI|nr:trans-1,2-dihydrobenzene-1,2-diol dehydrogenase-like [Patiria miniata]XP_038054877.1 trans-1,2-dihydrobenzene-1,2-diol dehydrogenase-like [Patiria miniata]
MKLRWGICSTGRISNDFVLALSLLPAEDHEVVAVAARSEASAKRFAEKHKIATAYEGYEALAKDVNVDIVHIGSWIHVHLPLCKLFLGHGKNVICETPLALSKREVQEILDLAKEKNLFFMESWWSRFFPAYTKLRELWVGGDIGDVKSVNASFGVPILNEERVQLKEFGGGGLMEFGVFLVNVTLMLFNQTPISWSTKGCLAPSGVDELAVTTIVFPNNAIATLTSSAGVYLSNEMEIRGTKGYIKIPPLFWCPLKMEVTTFIQRSDRAMDIEEKREVMEFPLPSSKEGFNYPNTAGFQYEAEAVRQCIMKGLKECPTVSHKDILLVHEILQDARHDVGYISDADKEQQTTTGPMPCQ